MKKLSRKFINEINSSINKYIPFNYEIFDYLFIEAVYFLHSKKEVLYIGYSSGLGHRLKSHFSPNSRTRKGVKGIKIIRFREEYNSGIIGFEAEMIDRFKPKYNKKNPYLGDFCYGKEKLIESLASRTEAEMKGCLSL